LQIIAAALWALLPCKMSFENDIITVPVAVQIPSRRSIENWEGGHLARRRIERFQGYKLQQGRGTRKNNRMI
jgi:hypothetical protein